MASASKSVSASACSQPECTGRKLARVAHRSFTLESLQSLLGELRVGVYCEDPEHAEMIHGRSLHRTVRVDVSPRCDRAWPGTMVRASEMLLSV